MGFFSWKTADTKESIPNIHANRPPVTVYMLQPNGKEAVAEPAYDGYGVFGGVGAYHWLLETNADHLGIALSDLNEVQRWNLGVSLECGTVCRDTKTGEYWHVFHDNRKLVPGKFANMTWDKKIPELGASANELLESGRFENCEISDVIELRYPLKFSFNKNAVYEDLPRSESCPFQGFFFDA
tara:strand:+ start:745 stop:1293 length:549 start_codon:yes stop_codon:yes gene_type:complete